MKLISEDASNIAGLYFNVIQESKKEAKQYLDQGKISDEEYNALLGIDPSESKKYTGWLARSFISGEEKDLDNLRNTVEEFDAFVRRGKLKGNESNIQSYKSFKSLYDIVNNLNQTTSDTSRKQAKGDFDVIVDNEDIRIVVPYTHEASRRLGLTPIEQGGFAFRDCEGGKKDSAWCTTYSTSTHWDDYYYAKYVDFFYILVKSEQLRSRLKQAGFGPAANVMALARMSIDDKQSKRLAPGSAIIKQNNEGNSIAFDAYDGLDRQQDPKKLETWMNIVGVS